MSDCSLDTASPGFTRTSMTSTSLKSPISGTTTWLMKWRLREQNQGQTTFLHHPGPPGRFSRRSGKKRGLSLNCGSYRCRVRLVRIDAVFLDRVGDGLGLAFAVIRQSFQSRDRDKVTVHLEEVAQLGARVRAAEAVGAEHAVGAVLGNEGPDLVGEGLDVVRRCDHRTGWPFLQHFRRVRNAWLRFGMEHVPAVRGEAVAPQLGEAGRAPHVGSDAPVFLEQLRRGLDLAQDGAAAEELDALLALAF